MIRRWHHPTKILTVRLSCVDTYRLPDWGSHQRDRSLEKLDGITRNPSQCHRCIHSALKYLNFLHCKFILSVRIILSTATGTVIVTNLVFVFIILLYNIGMTTWTDVHVSDSILIVIVWMIFITNPATTFK